MKKNKKPLPKNKRIAKAFKGSAEKIVAEQGSYKAIKLLAFCTDLKAIFKFSYIYDYKPRISPIANELGIDRKTVQNRIDRCLEAKLMRLEGDKTLRIISNTELKRKYASKVRSKKKLNYEYVEMGQSDLVLRNQPIEKNIRHQHSQIFKKLPKKVVSGDKKMPGRQLTSRELMKIMPTEKLNYVDMALLSQQKVASLLGYKSKSSGFRQLKRLSGAKFLEIESNCITITKDEYNKYKEVAPHKVLIKGRGDKAMFFFCNANTVKLIPRKKVMPELKYSVTSSRFLDNY